VGVKEGDELRAGGLVLNLTVVRENEAPQSVSTETTATPAVLQEQLKLPAYMRLVDAGGITLTDDIPLGAAGVCDGDQLTVDGRLLSLTIARAGEDTLSVSAKATETPTVLKGRLGIPMHLSLRAVDGTVLDEGAMFGDVGVKEGDELRAGGLVLNLTVVRENEAPQSVSTETTATPAVLQEQLKLPAYMRLVDAGGITLTDDIPLGAAGVCDGDQLTVDGRLLSLTIARAGEDTLSVSAKATETPTVLKGRLGIPMHLSLRAVDGTVLDEGAMFGDVGVKEGDELRAGGLVLNLTVVRENEAPQSVSTETTATPAVLQEQLKLPAYMRLVDAGGITLTDDIPLGAAGVCDGDQLTVDGRLLSLTIALAGEDTLSVSAKATETVAKFRERLGLPDASELRRSNGCHLKATVTVGEAGVEDGEELSLFLSVATLTVYQLCAFHVPDADGKDGSGVSDPYIRVKVLETSETVADQTSYVDNCENPAWLEELHLPLPARPPQPVVLVELWDKDWDKSDDLVGSLKVRLQSGDHGRQSAVLKGENDFADIPVTFYWTWFTPEPVPPEPAILILHDMSAMGVPDADPRNGSGLSDPYVRFELLEVDIASAAETLHVKNSLNPDWKEEMRLNVPRLIPPPLLRITLWDKDWTNDDDKLATGEVRLSEDRSGIAKLETLHGYQGFPDVPFTFSYRLEAID